MRRLHTSFFLFVVSVFTLSVYSGVDYKIDYNFYPEFNHEVKDIYVQPDGKIIAVGDFSFVDQYNEWYVARINPNGSVDTSFHSPLTFATNTDQARGLRHIKTLPNGQILVTGYFMVGPQFTTYARLNSDGSFDSSMALSVLNGGVEPLPDGKYIACGQRTIGGETYQVAHRLNSDGTPDPTFRVTFATGYCDEAKYTIGGKILITGSFDTGSPSPKPMYRLNPDGSLDTTFNADLQYVYNVKITETPDGKIHMPTKPGRVTRLNSNGSHDMTVQANCVGTAFLPLPGDSYLMTRCRKSPSSFLYNIARVRSDGYVDPSLDYIPFTSSLVNGFEDDGNGGYYLYGDMGGFPRSVPHLSHFVPLTSPVKAKFDFDGDGRSDQAVFRPSDGYWYIRNSGGGESYIPWGLAGDQLAAHDFDTDGRTDIAVFRGGSLHALSMTSGYRHTRVGQPGDRVVAGTIYDLVSATNKEAAFGVAPPELPGDVPVFADLDGDSWDDYGRFRDGIWDIGFAGTYNNGSFHWGMAGDVPVPADYDGDRQADYAVFRPSEGNWYILGSATGFYAMHWGMNGDVPVPADYDGDGKADLAIYRNGEWWHYLSATGTVSFVHWGMVGDLPVPAQGR